MLGPNVAAEICQLYRFAPLRRGLQWKTEAALMELEYAQSDSWICSAAVEAMPKSGLKSVVLEMECGRT